MRTSIVVLAALIGVSAAGCGATTRSQSTVPNPSFPALSSAVANFVSKEHGKDAGSQLTAQLLRDNGELAASAQVVGTKFDDNSASAPIALTLAGPFTTRDIDTGQLRVRIAPDGMDDWTFDLNLTLQFSNGSARRFLWRDVRLDNANPERVLTLAAAGLP